MTVPLWKSPDVLVTRRPAGAGITLRRGPGWGETLNLDPEAAAAWLDWDPERLASTDLSRTLQQNGFARCSLPEAPRDHRPRNGWDDIVPVRMGRHVKEYAETGDLHILFNTAAMFRANPLLALGPRASLVWRGIEAGWSISAIRQSVRRVFGLDGVIPFLRRLAMLGFVAPLPAPRDDVAIAGQDDDVIEEFLAPTVQHLIPHTAIPWYCLWEITDACDLHCRTCYAHRSSRADPATDTMLRIADAIAAAGIFYVALLGGEPLLRQDLETIIARLRQTGIYVKIITNGQTLSLRRAQQLHAADLNQVEVSFDGLSAKWHDRSRGQGTFARALAAIEHGRRAGIARGGMVLTLHSGNVGELPGLPEFMRHHAVTECYLSQFRKTGPLGGSAPWSPLDERTLHHVREQVEHWRTEAPDLTIAFPEICSCGRSSLVIDAHGAVRICPFAEGTAGNALTTPIDRIWEDLAAPATMSGPLGYCRSL